MTVFFGTLGDAIKELKAPVIFDVESTIALHAMQGNPASFHGEGKVSLFFSSCGETWSIFSSYYGDGHSRFLFVQRCQGSSLVPRDNSGFYSRLAGQ